jgi:hypothetical protein
MGYNVEESIKNQEQSEQYTGKEAMEKAKANIAERKLAEETRRVESRLNTAERTESDALKALRMARAKEAAQKQYLNDISAAKTAFEASGDCDAYDKATDDAAIARDKAINEAKRKIYGEDAWRY